MASAVQGLSASIMITDEFLLSTGVFKQAHLMEPLGDLMGRDIGQGSINGSDSEDELTTVIDEDPQVAPYGVATGWEGYISVSVLLSGIILARFGEVIWQKEPKASVAGPFFRIILKVIIKALFSG